MLASEVLIENFLHGSLESFDELINLHEREIYNLISCLIASEDSAQDAAANVFVRLIDEASTPAVRTNVRRELLRYACLEVRAFRFEQALAIDSSSQIELELPHTPAQSTDPAVRGRRHMKAVLAEMPSEAAMVFALRKVCKLGLDTAASVLEISEDRALARLTTACRIMRRSNAAAVDQNHSQASAKRQDATESVV